jgi:cleavage and polyadenylation specificity factor subunit 1
VAAVRDFPEPKNNRQLMSFLGMLNFYRRFLPRAAKVLKPLTDSLKGGRAQPVQWTDEKKAAFVAAKQLLTDATCLAHPRAGAEIQLAVDASNTHIGAVLQQASERGF